MGWDVYLRAMKRYRWEEYTETAPDGSMVLKWRQIVEDVEMPEPERNPNISDEVRKRRSAAVEAVRKAYSPEELEALKLRIYQERDAWGD